MYFAGRDGRNWFRTEYGGGEYWGWTGVSPYEEQCSNCGNVSHNGKNSVLPPTAGAERRHSMNETKKAIEHFHYGITHDIFSEPVKTYARLAVEALREQAERSRGAFGVRATAK